MSEAEYPFGDVGGKEIAGEGMLLYLLILSLISGQPEKIEKEAGLASPGHSGPHCLSLLRIWYKSQPLVRSIISALSEISRKVGTEA